MNNVKDIKKNVSNAKKMKAVHTNKANKTQMRRAKKRAKAIKQAKAAGVVAKGYTGTANGGVGAGRKPFSDEEFAADVRRVSVEQGYTYKNGKQKMFNTRADGTTVAVKMPAKVYTNHGIFSAIAVSKRFGSYADFRDSVVNTAGSIEPSDKMLHKELNRVLRVMKVDEGYNFTVQRFNSLSNIPWRVYRDRLGTRAEIQEIAANNDWDDTIR